MQRYDKENKMTQDERSFQIVRTLLLKSFETNPGVFVERWFTIRQIAKFVGLKPTNYLRTMLNQQAVTEALDVREGTAPNGRLRYEYAVRAEVLDSETYHEPFAKYFSEQGW